MRIVTSDEGMWVNDALVPWDSVVEITCYKIDLFIYDHVCLGFRTCDGNQIEMHESAEGFKALMTAIDERFEGVPPDWYLTVMFPAFERNYRVLWKRA